MTGFSQSPFKVSTHDGHNFVLLEPHAYVTVAGEEIVVPAGTVTDITAADLVVVLVDLVRQVVVVGEVHSQMALL